MASSGPARPDSKLDPGGFAPADPLSPSLAGPHDPRSAPAGAPVARLASLDPGGFEPRRGEGGAPRSLRRFQPDQVPRVSSQSRELGAGPGPRYPWRSPDYNANQGIAELVATNRQSRPSVAARASGARQRRRGLTQRQTLPQGHAGLQMSRIRDGRRT